MRGGDVHVAARLQCGSRCGTRCGASQRGGQWGAVYCGTRCRAVRYAVQSSVQGALCGTKCGPRCSAMRYAVHSAVQGAVQHDIWYKARYKVRCSTNCGAVQGAVHGAGSGTSRCALAFSLSGYLLCSLVLKTRHLPRPSVLLPYASSTLLLPSSGAAPCCHLPPSPPYLLVNIYLSLNALTVKQLSKSQAHMIDCGHVHLSPQRYYASQLNPLPCALPTLNRQARNGRVQHGGGAGHQVVQDTAPRPARPPRLVPTALPRLTGRWDTPNHLLQPCRLCPPLPPPL